MHWKNADGFLSLRSVLFQGELGVLALGQDEARGDNPRFIVLDLPNVSYERMDFLMITVTQRSSLSGFAFEVDPLEDDTLLA